MNVRRIISCSPARRRDVAAPSSVLVRLRFVIKRIAYVAAGAVLAVVPTILPTVHAAADTSSDGPFTMAVYGDAPYGTNPTDTAELDATPAFIDSINADPDVSKVMHVGDI